MIAMLLATAVVSLDVQMKATAEVMNRDAPQMIDATTRFDGAGYRNKTLTLTYTVLPLKARNMTGEEKDLYLVPVRLRLTSNACTSDDVVSYLKRGVTLIYAHYGKDGGLIGDVAITAASCASVVH